MTSLLILHLNTEHPETSYPSHTRLPVCNIGCEVVLFDLFRSFRLFHAGITVQKLRILRIRQSHQCLELSWKLILCSVPVVSVSKHKSV